MITLRQLEGLILTITKEEEKWMGAVMVELFPPQNSYVTTSTPVAQIVTLFRDRVFTEVIKIK